MKTPRPLLNLLFLSCLVFSSCLREETPPKQSPPPPQLPPETQEGKGTFGCLVNGEVWLPDPPNFSHPLSWTHSYPDQFSVTGQKQYTINGETVIEKVGVGLISGITGTGVYILNGNGRNGSHLITYPNWCYLITNSINSGIVEITRWDMQNYIVSGRFSFTVAAPGCDTIKVTEGRFDISL